MPYIGPDTVTLVFRDPAAGVDAFGRPNRVARTAAKDNCSGTITVTTERRGTGTVAVYGLSAMLPVDDDTRALKSTDAVDFDGRRYELTGDASVKSSLGAILGSAEDHVRVYADAEVVSGEAFEQITITPRNGRDDRGEPLPDGAPFSVIARGVTPGATAARWGVTGTLDSVEFVVALDLFVPIKDGDAVLVRGRRGTARVTLELEPWADRSQRLVAVSTRRGGS